MNELTLIKLDGGAYIDSRDVAEVVGKQHKNLLRDIAGYISHMENSTKLIFEPSDFFLENTYFDSTGRELPCYLLSKLGCEMVANKLTGEKGILFTAAYVKRFNDLENAEREELAAKLLQGCRRPPRLGEINACVRIIVKGFKNLGVSPSRIMDFLNDTYKLFGIEIDAACGELYEPDADISVPRWRTATEMAERIGMYSMNGNAHGQAVSCILNEIIFIDESSKRRKSEVFGNHEGFITLYDDIAMLKLVDWVSDNGFPEEIYGFFRTYHVQYSSK